ncbi:MAG: YceI family protein [Wenzhouxiangella sp.]
MAKKRFLTLPVLLLAGVLPLQAAAELSCFRADGDSGELNFRGEVEGTGFSGFFEDFRVRLCMHDEQLESAEIEVTVQMAAATVGNRQGDEALRGQYMFAVNQFPEAVWRSDSIAASGDGYRAQGQLSLRDISADQPVTLKLERQGDALWLSGTAEILRLDFNVGLGEFEDPDFVRNRIDLRFELELESAD